MRSYLENDRICRNQQLLAYFGEKNREDCGQCDICRKKIKASDWPGYEHVADQIRNLLQNSQELDFAEIRHKLDLDPERLSKTIELMVEKKWIKLNLHNKFELDE